MNWTTFLQNNAQSIFTLAAVLLGSAITFLGNYLNNRFQAKENDKQRIERRRDTKTQLARELMKNDIEHIENVRRITFEFINLVKILNHRRDTGELSQKEWVVELNSMAIGDKGGALHKLAELDTVTEVLIYTFGDKAYSIYETIGDKLKEYLDILANPSSTDQEKDDASKKYVAACAELQNFLREKLLLADDFD